LIGTAARRRFNPAMARIVLATMGSWGDIFPAIGLVKGLVAAGHDARIAASPAYAELVQSEQLPFAGIGPRLGFEDYAREPKILTGRLGGFVGFAHLFRHFIFPALDRYVDDLVQVAGEADLLLAHPALVAAPVAAEHTGVRWGTFSVFPGLIPTAYTPPAPTRVALGSGRSARALHRAAWSAARFNMARLFDAQVNRARRRLGLQPVSNAFFWPVDSGRPYLVMASPAVISRPADWPSNVLLTGFVIWDRPESVSELDVAQAFLDGGEPPILVTLGASSALDPQDFYWQASAAVLGLGYRALVLTGPTPRPVALPQDPRILGVQFAPLSAVASRCHTAIHHGGVGTTVALLKAGLPQLIVPRAFDQPQTSVRMIRLGIARSLAWRRANPSRLTAELRRLLGDPDYRRRARELKARLIDEDGLGTAVQRIGLLAGP
jgi:rhamnosyltransferase subunit B